MRHLRTPIKYNPLEELALFHYDNGDGNEGMGGDGMNDGSDSNGVGDGLGNNDNDYGGGENNSEHSGGVDLSSYKSISERNARRDDIDGLSVSYNHDGTIDVRYGGLFGGVMTSDPYGGRHEGGFLDAIAYDLGFRSSFTDSVDKNGNLTKNFDPVGFGNATVDVTMADSTGYGTIDMTGGTLASFAVDTGLTGTQAIALESIAKAGISLALGQPIRAIAPMAKALQVQGIIDAKTSHNIQAVGVVASFMKGMVSSLQSLNAINTAKSYGAINDFEAALMAGATLFGMYSGYKNMTNTMQSLGFTVTASDLRDFGVNSGGDGDTYINGTKITSDNIQKYMSSFALYIANRNKMDSLKDDIFERMAGSIFYNNFAAGGDIFNPSISPTINLTASIGKDISYSRFVQMSYLQNDFIDTAANPYNVVKKFEM